MKKIILIIITCFSFYSCDNSKEYEEKYIYPNSVKLLTLEGDTVIIENIPVRHKDFGDHQIKIKKHK